jgi:hypothetical protein
LAFPFVYPFLSRPANLFWLQVDKFIVRQEMA